MSNLFGTFYGTSGQGGNSRPRQRNPQVGGRNPSRGRNGGFAGGGLRELDITTKKRRWQKQCFCTPPSGYEDLSSQTIICSWLRNCEKCCQGRFGEAWGGQDAIQGIRQRR
jgi:hypothetical protein